MKWMQKNKRTVAIVLVIIFVIPFVLEQLIFNSTVSSNVSNDGWAGFWGGYIGAIIGAIATIISIGLEISYNERRRAQDETRAVRPYLCIHNFKWITLGNATTELDLFVQNVGLQAACDIALYTNNPDKERKRIYAKHLTLAASRQSKLSVTINLAESERYEFFYFDICGNSYTQELIVERELNKYTWSIVSCNTLEPYLYRDREYYVQVGLKK